MSNNLTNISPELLQTYQQEIASRTSPATTKRKMSSLKRFFNWAEKEGHVEQNPISSPAAPITEEVVTTEPKKTKSRLPVLLFRGLLLLGMVIIIFLLVNKVKLPIPFKPAPAMEEEVITKIEPTTTQVATLSPWTLIAKMNLKDNEGSPAIGSQTITFKLYKTEEDTQSSWASDTKQLTPDAEGDILISLSDVPTNLFFENERLFLAAETSQGELGSRLPVSTANISANLQGYYPADPEEGTFPNTIPVMSEDGSLLLATEAPAIKAIEGNLLIEGQTMTIGTTNTSDGDITINPDGTGIAHFLFEGTGSNFLNAQAPNLTSGSLYYGIVANNATGYDLMRLQSGSTPVTRFSIDALGNTDVGGNLNVAGDISTSNIVRLTSLGALSNITGYEQESGNFTIAQGAGDTATIIKKDSALSDMLTLTLDERDFANSIYSALTLKRYNGAAEAMALLIEEGNAQFNGQVRLGQFAANPDAIGEGSIVYNTGDDKLYYYTASGWAEVGSTGYWTLSGTDLYPNSTTYDIGIGLNNPEQKLTVSDNIQLGTTDGTRYIYFDNGTSDNAGIRYESTGNTVQFSHDGITWDDMGSGGGAYWQQISGVLSPVTGADDLAIGGTDSSAPFFVDDSGNLTIDTSVFIVDTGTDSVGIGNASPTMSLHIGTNAETHTLDTSDVLISSDLEIDGVLYVDGGTISNLAGTAAITFTATPLDTYNSLSASSWLVENTANVGLAALMVNQTKDGDIFTASAGASPKVTIDSSGHVGIGTTTPQRQLVVADASPMIGLKRSGSAVDDELGWAAYTVSGANDFRIYEYADSGWTSGNDRLTIQSGGNVGIGTNSPSYSLDVLGNARVYQTAADTPASLSLVGTGDTNATQIGLKDSDSNISWYLQNRSGASNAFRLQNYDESNWTAPFVVEDSAPNNALYIQATTGYVGVGTASPDGQLDVEGGGIYVSEISAPGTPNSGKGVLYEKTDGKLYFKNDAGTEYDLTRESIVYKEAIVTKGAQWVGSGSTVTVSWETEIIDEDNAFSTPEYTAPVTGNYDISWFINANPDRDQQARLQLDTGGGYSTIYTDYEGEYSGATADTDMTHSGTIERYPLSAGDKLRWQFYAWGGGNILAGSQWSIRRRETEGSDLAEWFQTPDQNLRAGDIITASIDNGAPVEPERLVECQKSSACILKSNKPYDESIVGIVSTAPGQTLGKADGTTAGYNDSLQFDNSKVSPVLVALAGRVPVKIWEGSGAIRQGDYITTSSEAGLGMKATKSGKVVGIAIEDWNPGENKDRILVFINPMYYKSPFMLAISEETGNVLLEDEELTLVKTEEVTSSGQSNTSSIRYLLKDGADTVLEELGIFTNLLVANIKAGMIATKELTADSLLAFQATVDDLLITNGLVSPVIETETISPLADSDLVFDLNNSPDASSSSYGKLIVKGEDEEEVASIDAIGNATFSGILKSKELVAETIYADEIIGDANVTLEEIEELLRQSLEDQEFLDDIADSGIFTATDSASLNELAVGNLFVTEQAAMNNLSISSSLAIGSDLLIQSSVNDNSIVNTINTLSAPLKLQSLAMAPIEIMAGRVRIDTSGNVQIAGDLYVAGEIEASGLTLRESGFGNLLNLVNLEGDEVATIDASGAAQFTNLTINKLVIASSDLEIAEPNIDGEIETNATIGSAVIPEGVREIKIINENINDYTLVYVTPTSSTLNHVLYVKSKGEGYFTVGFNQTISIDVNFNWWVIDVIE